MLHRAKTKRNEELRKLRESDPQEWTLKKLAERYGISDARVSEILNHPHRSLDRRVADMTDDPRET